MFTPLFSVKFSVTRERPTVSSIRMFVLIWAALLFSVRGTNADTGASLKRTTLCQGDYCITLSEGEISAEAGLCVVIPCSFTTGYGFTPTHIVWFKCKQSKKRCTDSNTIFHSNKNNQKVQSEFKGRVSLLEPDVRLKNCSIIVNDLTESDSGTYQLRVNGELDGKTDGFTFTPRTTVSVKDLTQKPTVMIPPLAEGQQATLTCTAPGLCSGSAPQITWTWRGAGESDSHITGNITAFQTDTLTAVTQRHSSTLTFNSSAEHHGTNVTCTVSFSNIITTEETVTLNVTYGKELKITGNSRVQEGETLNLTCSVESFPPSLITWTKLSDKNKQNGTETNLQHDTLTDLQNNLLTYMQNETETQEESGMGTLSIANVTAEYSGQYICTAKYLNNTMMGNVDVTVMYMKKPAINGDTTVQVGHALNLTCSVESFPPSRVTWTVLGSNTNLHNGSATDQQNDTGSATLVIHNVTAEHSGQYACTAKHLETTVNIYADVTVTWFSKILERSGCEAQSEILTCVCISEGFPLPTIKWPLLKNHTEYSVITSVSNHTVNSTITLTAKDHNNAAVECVSSNENGEAREKLTIPRNTPGEEDIFTLLKILPWLNIIVAFLIGVLLTSAICCSDKCHRKKHKSSGNMDETLEMVTSQEDPLIDADPAVGDDHIYNLETADVGGAVAAKKAGLDLNGGPKDVEYASIDFSKLKQKGPREAAKKQETTETEYAEIKKEVKKEGEDNDEEEGEELEGKEEVEELEGKEEGEELEGKEEDDLIGEDEETEQCVPEEEEGEDMAVYSNVKDIMGEI